MGGENQWKLFIIIGSIGLLISTYFLIISITWSPTQLEEIQDNNYISDENIWTDDLHILMPESLLTTWFKEIKKYINDNFWFNIIIHTTDKIEEIYTQENKRLYNKEYIDLAMVPTEILYTTKEYSKKIEISEMLMPYYNQAFAEVLLDETYTFIPHSIDPLIIFTKDNTQIPWNPKDWLDILTTHKPKEAWEFPILFWMSNQDKDFIKQNREFIENHFLILYHLLKQISLKEDSIEQMKIFLWLKNIYKPYMRNIADFIQKINKLQEKNKYCKSYPSICWLHYDLGSIRFGLLSDIQKIEEKFNTENIKVYPFWYTKNYPARWRWFIINKETEKERQIRNFLEVYMQASLIDIKENIRNKTIPASIQANTIIHNNQAQWSIYKNEYRDILIGDVWFFNIFSIKTDFIQTREWEQSIEIFVEKTKN